MLAKYVTFNTEKEIMTESINPVALADESGTVYTETGDAPAYVLVQLKKDPDSDDSLDVNVISEGLNKEQTISVLESVLKNLKKEETEVLEGSDLSILPL